MAAAIIELYSLADAVRTGTQNHDLLVFAWIGLTFALICRIEVRCERFKFRPAGIDPFKDRLDSVFGAQRANLILAAFNQARNPRIGYSHSLRSPQSLGGERRQSFLF